MPRNLSNTAILSAQNTETDEVWLVLMEINHENLDSPIYLVNNTKNIVSNGNEHIAYPFNIVLGEDDGEKLQTVKLTFDNVDRLLVETIRTIDDSPDITISIVLASDPHYEEIKITDLKLRQIEYDAFTISGTLYADDILNQRWPKDQITLAAGYYGLFR